MWKLIFITSLECIYFSCRIIKACLRSHKCIYLWILIHTIVILINACLVIIKSKVLVPPSLRLQSDLSATGKGWPLGSCWWCLLHFCYFLMCKVWYLIVSFPDLCLLSYFACTLSVTTWTTFPLLIWSQTGHPTVICEQSATHQQHFGNFLQLNGNWSETTLPSVFKNYTTITNFSMKYLVMKVV